MVSYALHHKSKKQKEKKYIIENIVDIPTNQPFHPHQDRVEVFPKAMLNYKKALTKYRKEEGADYRLKCHLFDCRSLEFLKGEIESEEISFLEFSHLFLSATYNKVLL